MFHLRSLLVKILWIAETEQGVALAILRGVIDFKREPWPQISESAKSLVKQMLDPDPNKRLTAQQVLGESSISCLLFISLLGVFSFGKNYAILKYCDADASRNKNTFYQLSVGNTSYLR